ncbi:MAG TPA: diguanylate cyclase [Noviherbaspirillum sp.]|uniref:diguanylate cyclase domain-containing protein n=1 Tax=Noviherbaspirillum sp. TaxID=1926288 RepID=UPI002D558016|nr:diguanylate cyclase [Noviherbaspirillum sp.]HYD96089.1 diguanylate cyclase [Noviherbaspirillum sp.]
MPSRIDAQIDKPAGEAEALLSALNERLCLALEASRQVAFDWFIAEDRLHFSGVFSDDLKALMLDTSRVWTSRDLPAVIHPEDRALFRGRLHQALKGQDSRSEAYYQVELRMKDALCSWRWVNVAGRIVERDDAGRARRMVGTFSDIEHRKQAEHKNAQLLGSEQFKSAILTAAPDCIVSIDGCGKIISFNQAAEQTFGYRSEDVLGCDLADIIIPPEWRQQHRQGVERVLATGESTLLNRRIELTAMRADGSSFPVELAVVALQVQGERMFTAFIRDISHSKRSQAMLKDSAVRYRQLVELSPEATFVYRNGKIALFNQAASRLLGVRDPAGLMGRSMFDFIHPDHHPLYHERARLTPQEAQPTPFLEQVWLRADGTAFDAEIGATNLIYNGKPSVQVVVRDITERKRAEALQLGQNQILNMVATGASLPEILHAIALFVEKQSGRGLCSILLCNGDGTALVDRVAPSLPASFREQARDMRIGPCQCSCGTAAFRGEPVIVTDIASDPLWASWRELAIEHGLKACTSWPIIGKNRKVLGTFALYFKESAAPAKTDLQLFGICTNLAGIAIESRVSEERIRYLAHYDGLTSLPNRFLFKEYLDLALRNARRHANKFAVLFLDLDRFKEINDTLGHDAGDLVLREMARRLRDCLRHTDKIARMGGDEFYVLIEELDDGRYAADVAQKLVEAAARPVCIGGREHSLSASIGIAIYPDDGSDGQMLLKNADKAMYRAKDMGKNAFQSFSPLKPRPAPSPAHANTCRLS